MRDDRELISEYVRTGAQAPFAELVERYVNLVYSAAARQVGDRHLAEDVTQGVFVVLAQKAKGLRDETVLGAWLLKVTRYAAMDAVKAAGRRRKHEQRAAAMNTETTQGNSEDAAQWGDLRGVIDEALLGLGDADRRAVVLRFLEQRSFEDVAERLGVSREAAKQRVFRAIEKLRARLAGRGVAVSAAALAALVSANAVQAAPAGLAVNTTGVAVAGLLPKSAAGAAAKGAVKLMAYAKAKAAAVAVAVALTAGGSIAVIANHIVARRPAPSVQNPAPVLPVADAPRPPAPPPAPPADDWFPKFHAVYGLADGEVIKRVKPPFIEERWDYWKTQHPRRQPHTPDQPMLEKQIVVEYDGRTRAYRWKLASAGDGYLSTAMYFAAGVPITDADGPPELLGIDLPGDWVYRAGAATEQRLAGLEALVRKEVGREIRIRKVARTKEVIVARGGLNLKGPVDDRGRRVIELGLGEKVEPAKGAPSAFPPEPQPATMAGVFDAVEQMFYLRVIDESGSGVSRVMLKQFRGPMGGKEASAWMDTTLTSLMQQTGLELSREQREIEVWEVSEAKK
jgi:RNA polymerase sigma factor (sigma-70 family)